MPYNNSTDRYEIELWGDHGADLRRAVLRGWQTHGTALA